ncbi:MAG: hypothetical protein K5745_02355 [Saccharofermentans sp.]|nr:hypothetical protein [Saccharofermentans sp.]
MNSEKDMLTNIKKSSHYGKVFSQVLFWIGIALMVITLIAGIGIISSRGKFDEWILTQDTEVQHKIGSVELINIDLGMGTPEDLNLESDIPALQAEIDAHPYSVYYGSVFFVLTACIAYYCAVMAFFGRAFKLIENSPTPFTSEVKKGLLIPLIGVAVIIAFTLSGGFAILAGILIWVIYSVLDYGIKLQELYDETL